MRIYFDNCSLNRPFDDQSQLRIRLETEAKLEVQARIRASTIELVWSYILDLENRANPFDERREAISQWRHLAVVDVEECKDILSTARGVQQTCGVRSKDALHLACAIQTKCNYLLTTDDSLIARMKDHDRIRVVNPIAFILTEG